MRKMNHMNSMKIKVRIGREKTGINKSAKISMTQTPKKIHRNKTKGKSAHLALSQLSQSTKKYHMIKSTSAKYKKEYFESIGRNLL